MNKFVFGVVAGVALAVAGPVSAGDAAAGKVKVAAFCASCHGDDGIGKSPIYPNLAGQKEAYLVAALKAYKSGGRSDATMKGMAGLLSEDDIANVAAYFSGL